jgi:hypothetical protein
MQPHEIRSWGSDTQHSADAEVGRRDRDAQTVNVTLPFGIPDLRPIPIVSFGSGRHRRIACDYR